MSQGLLVSAGDEDEDDPYACMRGDDAGGEQIYASYNEQPPDSYAGGNRDASWQKRTIHQVRQLVVVGTTVAGCSTPRGNSLG